MFRRAWETRAGGQPNIGEPASKFFGLPSELRHLTSWSGGSLRTWSNPWSISSSWLSSKGMALLVPVLRRVCEVSPKHRKAPPPRFSRQYSKIFLPALGLEVMSCGLKTCPKTIVLITAGSNFSGKTYASGQSLCHQVGAKWQSGWWSPSMHKYAIWAAADRSSSGQLAVGGWSKAPLICVAPALPNWDAGRVLPTSPSERHFPSPNHLTTAQWPGKHEGPKLAQEPSVSKCQALHLGMSCNFQMWLKLSLSSRKYCVSSFWKGLMPKKYEVLASAIAEDGCINVFYLPIFLWGGLGHSSFAPKELSDWYMMGKMVEGGGVVLYMPQESEQRSLQQTPSLLKHMCIFLYINIYLQRYLAYFQIFLELHPWKLTWLAGKSTIFNRKYIDSFMLGFPLSHISKLGGVVTGSSPFPRVSPAIWQSQTHHSSRRSAAAPTWQRTFDLWEKNDPKATEKKGILLLMAEILHQLRLVVYPIIRVSAPSQVVSQISAINSRMSQEDSKWLGSMGYFTYL